MRSLFRLLILAAAFTFASASAQAALISADFNDITTGSLNAKSGGTGFTASNWSGTSNTSVEPGNLTSSLYNKPQAGTAQKVRGTNSSAELIRQNFRTPSTPLTGEIWFSFLVSTASTERAGLSLNPPTSTPFANRGNAFVELQGTTLAYNFGHGSTQTVASGTTLDATVLIVGRMVLAGSGGNDSISIWVNPDLIANPDITAYTPLISGSSFNFADSITGIGVIAYRTDTTNPGGEFDNFYMSDAVNAYFEVTGVPEPGAAMLLGAAALGLALVRRKRVG